MTRGALFGVAFAIVIPAALLRAHDDANPAPPAKAITVSVELVQGKPIRWWADHAVRARRDANHRRTQVRELRRELAGDTTIRNAIDLAAIAYRVSPATLARKAACESTGGHGFNPNAHNAGSEAEGLFQFLPSTWSSTPFAAFSPYNPLAAALAAGWMHAQGRGGEWVCR